MKIKFDITTDTAHLESDLRNIIVQGGADLTSAMVKHGEDAAINGLQNIDTGKTLASIKGVARGNHGKIDAGGAAVWLEFGTGIAKNSKGYPTELPEGISPIGSYGKGGGSNPNGWYYYDENLKKIVKTKGIAANMFMYKAAQSIIQNLKNLVRGVFGK